MERFRIAVLTSSRADFSIYLPVLRAFRQSADIDLQILAFGSHTSAFHGHTISSIYDAGFTQVTEIDNLSAGDTAHDLVISQARTLELFSDLWEKETFDLVFCLGDRFEMFAAVMAGIPFGVPFAHIHGGETSLGAIDNIYRHAISLASVLHFTSCEAHSARLRELLDDSRHVFVSGAPALDNLQTLELLSPAAFSEKFQIDISQPTLLITLHPETVHPERNTDNVAAFCQALAAFPQQMLITKANADTQGSVINKALEVFATTRSGVRIVESLGPQGYYSALQHSVLVIGNSSSGLIEAASFGKYVINVGERQAGRMHGDNVISSTFDTETLIHTIQTTLDRGKYTGNNIFVAGSASEIILAETLQYLKNR
jgi:GDP/UDP-N,N'-diacetylbacillosamine 2-epimerase (hydrolysing)